MKNKLIYILIIIVIIIAIALYFYLNRKKYILDGDNMTYEKKEITCIINNQELKVELEDNTATKELLKKLDNDIEVSLSDYGNFEKVGALGFNLPTSDTNITTEPGDIVLYQGNNIVIFYGSNTWNYTKLGHITNINGNELKNILGNDNINITLKR